MAKFFFSGKLYLCKFMQVAFLRKKTSNTCLCVSYISNVLKCHSETRDELADIQQTEIRKSFATIFVGQLMKHFSDWFVLEFMPVNVNRRFENKTRF